MKYNFCLFLFLCFPFIYDAGAQRNQVTNPSFEEISACPDTIPGNALFAAIGWQDALGTPDLFNACSNIGTEPGVEYFGQECVVVPKSGNSFSGIVTYFTNYRTTEFMETKLKEKLKYNQKYYINFHVMHRRNCTYPSECYTDGIGLAFSDTFYFEQIIWGIEQIPNFTPAVQNPAGNILKDTINWTEVGGCYIAKGGEEFAILGNFKGGANTLSEGCIGGTGTYHFIDDVGVYEFDPLPDTILLCAGETQSIGQSFLNGTYKWSTGQTDSVINVSKAGTYIVNIALKNCILSDTVVVQDMDEYLDYLPHDTMLCQGEKLELTIPIVGDIQWSTGEEGNHISIKEEGEYSVTLVNDCGEYNHSFEVESEVCDCNIYVPNVITPNGDHQADYLECFVGCDFPYKSILFQVFDRWGGLVYSNNSPDYLDIKWDGTHNGKSLDTGVYAWFLQYEYIRNGKVHRKTINGDVAIVK